MNIIQLPLGEVHPYKNNPRKNDGAVDAVAESIRQYGFLVPLVISADHEIITGHTRFKAAKKLGLSSVPCVIADELTEEQIKAFRLVDNKVGELAEGDEKAIINHNEIGPVTQKLYDTLTGIQWGRVPDPHGWIMKL